MIFNRHSNATVLIVSLFLIIFFVHSRIIHADSDPVPQTFSWANKSGLSYIGHVSNQNFPQACASGWAIATTNALNSRIKIRRNATVPDITLSPQVLLNCDNLDHGCLGGEPLTALKWISKNNITDESCQPYLAKGHTNGMKCNSQAKCRICFEDVCFGQTRSKIYGLHQYGTLTGEQNMMTEINRYGPIPCGISAADSLKNYTKGILKDQSGSTKIDHFVMVYGWGSENGTKYWNVMNSWGAGWGESGFFRILRGANNLGIETRCYWAGLTDTWTDDIRNQTLPSNPLEEQQTLTEEENQFTSKSSLSDQLPPFLLPSRSSASITSCQSGWAFAVTSMLSDRQYKQTKGTKYVMLSVQALLNCGVGTCEKGGDPLNALIFIHKYGVPEESCQNYQGKTPEKESCSTINNCATCKGTIYSSKCQQVKSYNRWKIFDYGTLSGSEKMKDELLWGPIVCGVQSTEKFRKYTGGIFTEYSAATKPNHYVEVIGFGEEDEKKYWIFRNSWGTAWGESGFGRMIMNSNNLGIEQNCYWGNTLML